MTVAAALAEGIGTIKRGARRIRELGDSPRADAELLLAHVLGRERGWLLAHARDEMSGLARERFASLIDRRAGGVPVAYLVGQAGFFGRSFMVDERVLVPRPETELVVEAALNELRSRIRDRDARRRYRNGSGAIAVTLACELPRVAVYATDCSDGALAIARANAEAHGVAERCAWYRGDLGAPLALVAGPLDCVVANLPYIPTRDVPPAPAPVGYEPFEAFDGGADGLVLYRRLLDHLPVLLAPGASCYFEAAPPTIDALADLCARVVPSAHLEIGEDYAGLERFVSMTMTR